MTWSVGIEDITLSSDTVTIAEAILFQDMRSKEIDDASPGSVRADAFALLIAHVMGKQDCDQEAAMKILGPLQLGDLKIVDDGAALPKDESDSTVT